MTRKKVIISNGTGLESAMYHCGCEQCVRDSAFQEAVAADEPDPPDGRKILERIMVDNDYSPKEWTIGDDGCPQCSEYVLDEGTNNHYKAPESACPDMFDDGA